MADDAEGTVRILAAADLTAFRSVRLEALRLAPQAFLASLDEELALSEDAQLARIAGPGARAVFGAFVGGRLVGTAGFGLSTHAKQAHRGVLWGVYVEPGHRGRRLARRLVEAVIAHARDHVSHLDAVVVASNEPARRLYEALGFVQVGFVPRSLLVDGEYHDDVLLALAIPGRS